jgi:hypothetical protein
MIIATLFLKVKYFSTFFVETLPYSYYHLLGIAFVQNRTASSVCGSSKIVYRIRM